MVPFLLPAYIMKYMKKPTKNKNKAHEAPRKKNYNNIKEYKKNVNF